MLLYFRNFQKQCQSRLDYDKRNTELTSEWGFHSCMRYNQVPKFHNKNSNKNIKKGHWRQKQKLNQNCAMPAACTCMLWTSQALSYRHISNLKNYHLVFQHCITTAQGTYSKGSLPSHQLRINSMQHGPSTSLNATVKEAVNFAYGKS